MTQDGIKLLVIWIGITFTSSVSGAEENRQRLLETQLLPAVGFTEHPTPRWSVTQRMHRYRVPGLSVALISNGVIEWTAAYGNSTVTDGRPIQTSTLFQSASISKWVTAVGVLKLAEEKNLSLDKSVNQYLKNWVLRNADNRVNDSVTLRHLLAHQSGISVRSFDGYEKGESMPSALQILDGLSPANSAPIRVTHEAGEQFQYSGGAYQVIQQLIEDSNGETFATYMQKAVFQPAKMNHSSYAFTPEEDQQRHTACGHDFNGESVLNCGRIYPELAAAWLWSTPTDLAHLGLAMIDAAHGRKGALLSAERMREMLTPNNHRMGLGAGAHGEGQNLHFDHSGWTHGFRSYFVVYPYLGKGIVVMANANGGHELINEVVRSAALTYQWPDFKVPEKTLAKLSDAQLEAMAGEYLVGSYGFSLQVSRAENYLQIDTPRGSRYSFYPISERQFIALEDGSLLSFSTDDSSSGMALNVWHMNARKK